MNQGVFELTDLAEANAFFRKYAGRPVCVWRYDVSHSCLELLFTHAGEVHWQGSTAEYTTIVCRTTYAMTFPVVGWSGHLIACRFEHPTYGSLIRLADDAANVGIECEHLSIWVGHHPKF